MMNLDPTTNPIRVMLFKEEGNRIEPYLPGNYIVLDATFLPDDWRNEMANAMPDGSFASNVLPRVERDNPRSVVIGQDKQGWTLTDYIVPRFASGMIFPLGIAEDAAHLAKLILLGVCGHGFEDESDGNVESTTGHFMRVNRYLLYTSNSGQVDLYSYPTEDDAMRQFREDQELYHADDEED